ncbi:MscL family protein [Calidifontibacter sp. DB0510]|uniref:MscL family protein n=1 Tax=Metallococcus carri TaxID=1656884 RepID=A0A967AYX5_9MICO|nr:MscL family protein [Metallococcus carri]NHN55634.1 MscL family protein [Metallococcus carri]NOP38182.1 MscL family protein [Calidifontibacter sp. DB2511S]
MSGFKKFLMQGNLVELAVAVVIAGAFGKVVEAMVTLIMDLVGKAGGTPNFSGWTPGGIHVGAFITALIAFIILAAVVYFAVIVPYTKAQERFGPKTEDGETPTELDLLAEIRDALVRGGRPQI